MSEVPRSLYDGLVGSWTMNETAEQTILDRIYETCGQSWRFCSVEIEIVKGFQIPAYVVAYTLGGLGIVEVGEDWLGDKGWAELVALRIRGEIKFERKDGRLLVHSTRKTGTWNFDWKEWYDNLQQQPIIMSDPPQPATVWSSSSSDNDWGNITTYCPFVAPSGDTIGMIDVSA